MGRGQGGLGQVGVGDGSDRGAGRGQNLAVVACQQGPRGACDRQRQFEQTRNAARLTAAPIDPHSVRLCLIDHAAHLSEVTGAPAE